MNPAREFLLNAAAKSVDLAHRKIIRKNMDHYEVRLAEGVARFADWEGARDVCSAIKDDAIEHLGDYLKQFEAKVKARGGVVFWAETAEEARDYVANLARDRGVKRVVKSKSMVTEEIHLTSALERAGCEVLETDLGEYIVQLRNEPPYHIVTPAMHLTRKEIYETFKEKLPGITTDEPVELVAAARRVMREFFFSAEMGISGANFLVADSGMIALTTNEGNARLGTALPRIHVVVTGIEKVVPKLSDLGILWPTLAGAATGQSLSAYNTLIGGPRRQNEVDGPEEFHVVLLDNGRTALLAESEQREALKCIRCGACLNNCPVYRQIGGHAYGTTYQGPIGSVLTPHFRGHDFDHLSYASSLCGACTAGCPVKIDLHHHLLRNRRNAVQNSRPLLERIAFRLFRWTMLSSARYTWFAGIGKKLATLLRGTAFDPLREWNRYRTPPQMPKKSFRQMWRDGDV
ncbi:MAG TPA: LutB/LldF family L-lactate oxidation iron-sulfur protein [Terriglobales bacterium]|nr:LutB/LldF family L-lactate oxidation iron-sulfur protein [Terriglobales bacterium]